MQCFYLDTEGTRNQTHRLLSKSTQDGGTSEFGRRVPNRQEPADVLPCRRIHTVRSSRCIRQEIVCERCMCFVVCRSKHFFLGTHVLCDVCTMICFSCRAWLVWTSDRMRCCSTACDARICATYRMSFKFSVWTLDRRLCRSSAFDVCCA